jgi:hypothetical protein
MIRGKTQKEKHLSIITPKESNPMLIPHIAPIILALIPKLPAPCGLFKPNSGARQWFGFLKVQPFQESTQSLRQYRSREKIISRLVEQISLFSGFRSVLLATELDKRNGV